MQSIAQRRFLFGSLTCLVLCLASHATDFTASGDASHLAARGAVGTGASAIAASQLSELSHELYEALDSEQGKYVSSVPILIGMEPGVSIQWVAGSPGQDHKGRVLLSAGCLELMAGLAHAKAMDRVQPGFFTLYAVRLATNTNATESAVLADIAKAKRRAETLANDEASNFRELIGMAVAIELAHHYLGHYRKDVVRPGIAVGQEGSINDRLTAKEWEAALEAGTRHALGLGLGIEGMVALYQAVDQMPTRPAWTAYFVPSRINCRAVNRQLAKVERGFFKRGN